MARFSQGFLSNLGRPAMTESMFNLGAAIGNVPNQYKAQKVRQANAEAVSRLQKNSPEYYEELARQAEIAGDMDLAARYVQAAAVVRENADRAARRQIVEGREDQAAALQERGRITQAQAVMDQLQGIIDSPKSSAAAKTQAQRLLGTAAQGGEAAALLGPQVNALLKESGRWRTVGNETFDEDTGKYVAKPVPTMEDMIAQHSDNFTAKSIGEAYDPKTGVLDPSKLLRITKATESKDPGISPQTEKWLAEMDKEVTEGAIALERNNQLISRLAVDKGYTSGIASDLRTSVLNFAGLRDATEEDKTAYIRSRNNALVSGLPPGVASDSDIILVANGLPPDNASAEEVSRYLQAENRILRAKRDLAMVSEMHVIQERESGRKGTLAGVNVRKQQFGAFARNARARLDFARENNPEEFDAFLEKARRDASEYFGFTPAFFEEY